MELTLDYNVELYPLKVGESFSLVLASSLVRPGTTGEETTGDGENKQPDVEFWRPGGRGKKGIEQDYEYVMYGRIYRFDSGKNETV